MSRTRILRTLLVGVLMLACADASPPPPLSRPSTWPSLLAGCYAVRWGGPTYGSDAWPEGWAETFLDIERFAVAPVRDLDDGLGHEPQLLVLRPRVDPLRFRVDARLTADADSLLFAVGRSTGLTFRVALEGDTLPGVAALWDAAGAYDPARYLRYVMAVRVDCATGDPVALEPEPGRRP